MQRNPLPAVVTLLVASCVAPADLIGADESPAQRFLREAVEALDGRSLTLEGLRRLATVPGTDRHRVLAIRARFEREIRNDPVGALELLLPELAGAEQARTWRAANREHRRIAGERWRERRRRARRAGHRLPPEPDDGSVHAPLPAPAGWRIEEGTAYLAVEAVRTLGALGERLAAQEVCRAMGQDWGYGLPRILAGEAYGDLLALNERPREALDAYDFALRVCDQAIDAMMQPAAEIRYVRGRVRATRKRVKRLLKMPAAAKWYEPGATPVTDHLAVCQRSIAERRLVEDDLDRLQGLAEHGDEDQRAAAAVLLARLHRLGGHPARGLATLAPALLDEPWPAGEASSFPVATLWNLKRTASAAEAARCLVSAGERRAALIACERLKAEARLVPHALAVEVGARLQMAQRRHDAAIGLFRYNLDLLPWFLVDRRGGDRADRYGEVARLRRRNRDGLRKAERLRDADRFGPGFVAYRAAEGLRRERKDPLAAYRAYDGLIAEYPESIYAEASRCYRIYCLLDLATETGAARVAGAVADAEERLARLVEERDAARRERVVAALLERRQRQIDACRSELAVLRGVPVGGAAREAAERAASDLVSANPYGLYRGEALLALGDHLLFVVLDQARAERYLARAHRWCEEAATADTELAAFAIPDQAREVTAAPENAFGVDDWGNLEQADVPIGAVIHRRTAPWYLDRLRARAAGRLGFLAFVDGRLDDARRWYEVVRETDPETAYLAERDEWNDYRRLTWGLEHGYLYAHPEELARYRGRQRFAVLLADFAFVNGDHARAAGLYRDLLDDAYGELAPAQRDYPRYALAACHYYRGDRERALAGYMSVLDRRDGTYTEIRAAYVAGRMAGVARDEELRERGMALLRGLALTGRDDPYVHRAAIVYGRRLIRADHGEEGASFLARIPAHASGYRALADLYLAEYRKETKEGNDNE